MIDIDFDEAADRADFGRLGVEPGSPSAAPARELPDPPASASTYEEAVLIAGGPVRWPVEPHVPDLAHIRARMPERSERHEFLVHALRFFEDVLAYAERLEAEREDADV